MRSATAVVGGGYGASRGSGQRLWWAQDVALAVAVTAVAEAEKLEWLRASLWEGEYEMTK